MYKSSHPYDGKYEGSLGFDVDEKFLSLRKENEYWSLVVDKHSKIGYVPNNCLQEIFNCDPNITLDFIDNGFQALVSKKASQISNSNLIFKDLVNLRTELLSAIKLEKLNEVKAQHVPKPSQFAKGSSLKFIDILRRKTGSDYFVCLDSFYSIIDHMDKTFPAFKSDMDRIKEDLTEYKSTHSKDNAFIPESFDASLTEKYLIFIEKRLGNRQESEWSLHEDYYDVKKNLNDFLALIYNANPNVIRMKIKERHYRLYEMLVEMYRDEKRMTIRTLLLLCVVGLCQVDGHCLKFVCSSILPVELIREIYQLSPLSYQSHYITCLRAMSMLLANCNEISIQVISSLSKNFFANLLLKISPEGVFMAENQRESFDNPISKRPNSISDRQSINLSNLSIEDKYFLGQLEEAAFSFIVSANKHMRVDNDMSPLVESIKDNLSLSKKILENLLVNFNWENDVTNFNGLKLINSLPTSDLNIDKRHFIDPTDNLIQCDTTKFKRNTTIISDYKNIDTSNNSLESKYIPKHPTRRFLFDLMRHSDIVKIFYRNDIEVAIRILLRHISDLSDDRDLLLEYLSILEILLINVSLHHSSILSCHLNMIKEAMDLIKERSEDYPSDSMTDSIKQILASIQQRLSPFN